jgi:hypothetical protein
MPGICPKCVKMESEGAFCQECSTPLMSPADWKQQRDSILQSLPAPVLLDQPQAITITAGKSSQRSPEENKEFVFGFFLGALLFFFAFLSVFLVFGDWFNK